MRTIKLFCSIMLLLLPYHYSQARDSAPSQPRVGAVIISPDLSYATDFVRFLQSAGLVVLEVLRSHHEAMLGRETKAAFIRTNKGVVEVVFLPGEADAEKITITYSRNSSPTVPHKYIINGEAINGRSETWETACPAYITLYRNWFIVTSEYELEAVIKRALRQDNRPARQ